MIVFDLTPVGRRSFAKSGSALGSHQLVKTLPYERAKVYSVIVDVQSYPEFVPYCLATTVLHSAVHTKPLNDVQQDWPAAASDPPASHPAIFSPQELHVLTRIGYKGFETDYHSQVICTPLESVRVIARPSATFRCLTTEWRLSEVPGPIAESTAGRVEGGDGTQVELDLSFKFKNPIHEFLLTDELVWKKFSSLIIRAFERRLAALS
ncbi:hypothetical protein VP01_1683g4 [Puccinia sorghi]|uniref:Coenzyme Q-binding protein COQ10 START domain-containing protein n=1 Tax=Puccinia sorghi TaxID=27349 RepID=A0A0L6VFV8_9BASI|nr:hypothetical protein VP01_1683g4 [Puccinia sorghi]